MTKVRKKFVSEAMANWLTLNKALSGLNKEEVLFAMRVEGESKTPRKTFLKRLMQRYNGIRFEEVKKELG